MHQPCRFPLQCSLFLSQKSSRCSSAHSLFLTSERGLNISTNDGRFSLRYVLFFAPNSSGCLASRSVFLTSERGFNSCTNHGQVSFQCGLFLAPKLSDRFSSRSVFLSSKRGFNSCTNHGRQRFPPMRLISGAKVEWMFLHLFLISDHEKEDLIPAPIMVGFPSDAAYFWHQSWAEVFLPAQCFYHQKEDLILAPIMVRFPSDAAYFCRQSWADVFLPAKCFYHQKENLIPAPIMGRFPSDASYFWCQSRAVVPPPVNSCTNHGQVSIQCVLFLVPKSSGCSSARSSFLTLERGFHICTNGDRVSL